MVDLDCCPKPKINHGSLVNAIKDGNGVMIEATLKSSFEGSIQHRAMASMSSGTSYGKEPVCENTIEQILGNIERSHLGGDRGLGTQKEKSNDSYEQSK